MAIEFVLEFILGMIKLNWVLILVISPCLLPAAIFIPLFIKGLKWMYK